MAARRVIVVGAGFAGLEAARRLAAGGCEVTLLERGAAAGGRARPPAPGGGAGAAEAQAVPDPAAHVVRPHAPHLALLLRGLGLGASLEIWDTNALTLAAPGGPVAIDPSRRAGIARIPGVGLRGAWRVPRFGRLLGRFRDLLDPASPERGARLDDRSAADFGRLYFGAAAQDAWLDPLLRHAAQQEAAAASRLLVFLEPGLAPRGGFASLAGGPSALAEAAAAALPTHFGVEALGLAAAPDRTLRLRCLRRSATGETPPVDAVVLALPPAEALRVAGPLLSDAERDVLGGVRIGAALSVALALRAPLGAGWRRAVVPSGVEARLVALAHEAGATPGAPGGTVVLVASSCAAEVYAASADDVVAKELVAAAERLVPGLAGRLASAQVQRWPLGLPRFEVGAFRAIGRLQRVQRDRRSLGRRLYFAGDWLVAPSLEGALASGARAAADVLEDLARR